MTGWACTPRSGSTASRTTFAASWTGPRHPAGAGPPRTAQRPGVGEPAAAATRSGTVVRVGVRPAVEQRGRQRPFRRAAGHVDRQGGTAGLLGCAARGGVPTNIAHHQHRFFSWCAGADVPEVTTLAETIDHQWPEVLAFLRTGITNAGTEGTNHLVKQVVTIHVPALRVGAR